MINSTVKVLGEVLKQPGVFKSGTITEATGLSRQLVYNKLSKFYEQGWLVKSELNGYYLVSDRDKLISEMVRSSETVDKRRLSTTSLFQEGVKVPFLNKFFTRLLIIEGLGLRETYSDLRPAALQSIDETIAMLKSFRKYVVNTHYSEAHALSLYKKDLDDFMTVYDNALIILGKLGFTWNISQSDLRTLLDTIRNSE